MNTGAIDIHACPTRFGKCRCEPKCRVCGHGMHMAVHGPFFGKPPGTEPWGHQFEAVSDSSSSQEPKE